jgi:hypothetical protein
LAARTEAVGGMAGAAGAGGVVGEAGAGSSAASAALAGPRDRAGVASMPQAGDSEEGQRAAAAGSSSERVRRGGSPCQLSPAALPGADAFADTLQRMESAMEDVERDSVLFYERLLEREGEREVVLQVCSSLLS